MFSWEDFREVSISLSSSTSSGGVFEDCFFGLVGRVFSPKPWPEAERDHDVVGAQRVRGMRGDGIKPETGEIDSDAAMAAVRATETMVKAFYEQREPRGEEAASLAKRASKVLIFSPFSFHAAKKDESPEF